MTVNSRLNELALNVIRSPRTKTIERRNLIVALVQSEVDAAVRAERERCAVVADNFNMDSLHWTLRKKADKSTGPQIAKAIRLSKLEEESK